MMNSDMILKSCKVMMTCVCAILSFFDKGWVILFELVLHVRAHPQIFGLELRAPMGAYPEQYGIYC